MKIAEQKFLRAQTASIMEKWAGNRQPPFVGETPGELKDAITAAHILADEAKLELHRWVDAARRTGLSWTDIGDTLGISKQAAQQRFKPEGPVDEAPENDGETIRRFGATAFNEVEILREEGMIGRELVSTGILSLVFRPSPHNWEYQRRIGTPMIGEMQKAGWTYVSSWLPFHYFKRPLLEE